jgi:hypothetical protein
LALHKNHMISIIRRNGHLVLEGDETTDDLKLALLYLRPHTIDKCRRYDLGVPIETLIPDISVVTAKSIGSRNVKTAAIRGERL